MARGKTKAAVDTGPVDGPWDLPDGWRWERLGDLGEWYGGGTPSKQMPSFWTDGTIPWVSPKDMKKFLLHDTEDHITHEALASSATKLVPGQSVVCVMRSGILKHSFPVAVISREMTLNQDLRALHPEPEISALYVAYFLRGAAQSILHECAKDGTTVDSIDVGRLMDVRVPVPREEVQSQIVARIDALYAEIDAGETALADARSGVETYRKSLLKAAVTGELTADWRRDNPPQETGADLLHRILTERREKWEADPKNARKKYVEPVGPDTNGLPSVPDTWTWASLDQLSWSAQYGTSQKCDYSGAGEPVLRIPNLRSGDVSLDDLKRATLQLSVPQPEYVMPGDLLIVRTNGSKSLIGRAGMTLDDLPDATYFASYLIRYRLTGTMQRWKWVRAFTGSSVFRANVLANIASSAGQYNLSIGKLDSFAVAVPPDAEIAEALDAFSAASAKCPQIEAVDAMTDQARTLRQSILAAAFRGELTL